MLFLWWRFKLFYDGFSWNQVYIRILGIRGESATYRILWANKCQSNIISLIYTEIFNVKAKSWSPLGKQILKDFKCINRSQIWNLTNKSHLTPAGNLMLWNDYNVKVHRQVCSTVISPNMPKIRGKIYRKQCEEKKQIEICSLWPKGFI